LLLSKNCNFNPTASIATKMPLFQVW
jgi:hypothetical protein